MDMLTNVREMAGPLALAEGVELLDVALVREGSTRVLRLVIERAAGPTTIADCEAVSHAVSRSLDARDLIPFRYHLEVSTAGADRPLRTAADFRRSVGRLVRVEERGVRSGPVVGTLAAADEVSVAIDTDAGRRTIALADVASARREVPFGPGRGPGGRA
jgi:ribosome maturation factor RimP